MSEKKEPVTRVINHRLYIQGGDGMYSAVPTGMDDARDLKARPAPRYAVNPADDEAYMVVGDLRKYVHGLEQGGAPILRAAIRDMSGSQPDDLRRLVHNGTGNICVPGSDGIVFISEGSVIDTTDPEHPGPMQDVPDGSEVEVRQSYRKSAVPGQDGRLTARDLRYVSYDPGSTHVSDGVSHTVSEGVSVPVRVLFNENSTAGEVQMLCGAGIHCTDGVCTLDMDDTYVMGHEDLSETAAFRTPVDQWIEDEHARDEAYAAAYVPKKPSSLDRMRDMARETDAREAEKAAGREAGNDGRDI